MPEINIPAPKRATSEQIRFIEILAGDLGFNRNLRNAHINDIIKRKLNIHYLDELTLVEAQIVIDQFKFWKER